MEKRKPRLSAVLAALVVTVSCMVHHRVSQEPKCHPLAKPLSVDGGAVSIECASRLEGSFTFSCTIRSRDTGHPVKSGNFMLAGSGRSRGFDPQSAKAYAGWDGCFTIFLQDGRRLEEVETITSGCGRARDFQGGR